MYIINMPGMSGHPPLFPGGMREALPKLAAAGGLWVVASYAVFMITKKSTVAKKGKNTKIHTPEKVNDTKIADTEFGTLIDDLEALPLNNDGVSARRAAMATMLDLHNLSLQATTPSDVIQATNCYNDLRQILWFIKNMLMPVQGDSFNKDVVEIVGIASNMLHNIRTEVYNKKLY